MIYTPVLLFIDAALLYNGAKVLKSPHRISLAVKIAPSLLRDEGSTVLNEFKCPIINWLDFFLCVCALLAGVLLLL